MRWSQFQQGPLARSDYRLIFIFEANLDWSVTLYQRPHHLALALGRHGCLVLYKTTGDGVSGFRPINENVWLVNGSSLAALTGAVRCFYSTSLFATGKDLLAANELGITIYEYIDHIDAAISGGQSNLRRLQELKATAFAHADLVVSSAKLLFDEARLECGEQRCFSIPNGVDIHHYAEGKLQPSRVARRLLEFREKHTEIVGYFGAIAPWLWYELIEEVCSLLPDIGFVFIGPDYSGCVPRLPRRANALYLGPVSYDELPAHANLFDVCFIPFVKGDIARSTSPLKLFEYFALEKPVVVTSDMLECTAFEEVFSGSDAHEVVECIESALARRGDPHFKVRLRSLAEANSWDVRAKNYICRIEDMKKHSAGQ
jgi:teichuronic acid biosynthesis glycosyltransferase TuaH